MGHDYLDALMTAAAAGDAQKPYVSVTIQRYPMPSIVLRSVANGFTAVHMVPWPDFMSTKEPAAVLLAAVASVRKRTLDAAIT